MARAPPVRRVQELSKASRRAADRTPPRVAGAVPLVGERAIEVLCGSAVHPHARGDLRVRLPLGQRERLVPEHPDDGITGCGIVETPIAGFDLRHRRLGRQRRADDRRRQRQMRPAGVAPAPRGGRPGLLRSSGLMR